MDSNGFTEFERRARLIAPYFNQRIRYSKEILPPPIICEFLGTPYAGKSTIVDQLDKFWKRQGYRTYPPQEGADAIRYIERSSPFYNIATGLYAFNLLMQVSEGHQYDHVFFERCVFDAYTWMKYWFKKKQLDRKTMQMLQESFLQGASRIDFACVMVCDPSVALKRDKRFGTTSREGKTSNLDTMSLLIECNLESYEELKDEFPQLMLFDTTALDETTMVQKLTDFSVAAVEKKVLATPIHGEKK